MIRTIHLFERPETTFYSTRIGMRFSGESREYYNNSIGWWMDWARVAHYGRIEVYEEMKAGRLAILIGPRPEV